MFRRLGLLGDFSHHTTTAGQAALDPFQLALDARQSLEELEADLLVPDVFEGDALPAARRLIWSSLLITLPLWLEVTRVLLV